MPEFRIQRFRMGERFDIIGLEDAPPATGWAIRADGAVFRDGAQVGVNGTYQIGSTHGVKGYSHIDYQALTE